MSADTAMMYFVGQGDCKVKVRDQKGREVHTRSLYEGDHFGEIALMHKCKRSATVISSNYNTLATLIAPRFKEIMSEYPEYENSLRQHIITEYGDGKDPKITFLKRMIKQVPYLKNIENEILFDIMFCLKSQGFDKDTLVIAEEKVATSLYFIESGCLEVYSIFEVDELMSDFVIEKLYSGSAINHRAYFMQDLMYVNIRCIQQAKLLELPYKTMKEIQEKHATKKFSNEILFYQNRILK